MVRLHEPTVQEHESLQPSKPTAAHGRLVRAPLMRNQRPGSLITLGRSRPSAYHSRHHALSYEAVCREPLSTFTMAQPGMRRTSSAQGLSPITDTPTIAASAFKSGSEHQFHTSPTLPAGVDVEATTAAVAAADEARADSIINGNCGDPSMGGLDVLPDPADIFQPVEGSALSESLSQSHPLECILTDHTEAAAAECGTHFDAAPTGVQEAPAYLTSSNSVSDDTGMPHCNGDVTQLEDELAAAEWELVGQSLEGEQVEVIDSEEYVLL